MNKELMMDGYQTPPTSPEPEMQTYSGGMERNDRINQILGVFFSASELARFNIFFPEATESLRATQRQVSIMPEGMTFRQFQQLKAVKDEEELMMRLSGEPRSQVMDRLNHYAEVMDVFAELEPTYQQLSNLLNENMPDEGLLFQQKIQNCNISEIYALFKEARRLLSQNLGLS